MFSKRLRASIERLCAGDGDGEPAPEPSNTARITVVDLGSGSGNMALPLAWLMPHVHFVALDMNASAISLLRQRATDAALANVSALVGTIEQFRCVRTLCLTGHTSWAVKVRCQERRRLSIVRNALALIATCCLPVAVATAV